MENLILILLCISFGYLISKLKVFSKDAATTLNQFAIYISLPSIILLQIPKLNFTMEAIIPIIIAWVVMTISAVLVLLSSKYFNFSKEVTGALMLVAVLTNSSFLGIPIISTYLGDSSLPYILIYDQFGTFIAFSIYGTFIASFYANKKEISFKLIFYKIVTFPPFMALIAGLLLMGTEFNKITTDILKIFANTTIPVTLVAVGLQLQFKLPKEDIKPFSVALAIKLFIAPLIAIVICEIFSWHNEAAMVSILEAGMSPMITAGAIAAMVGLAPRLSSAIVGYGILISLLSSFILHKIII
ncbi:hypothetical protein CRV08_13090 [Halarcobacter ebronensis]|uniref:Transporter n=1 Tax=Halarcobacter ebronensis TaxID=1462615 RepID=A0A4Q0Y860_9BACT|nr:AEC family transporter [Halarcobacter ebronensis]RXJ66407.1 hypothetical protein CRV08_13090 [Halarcobacter ebronensis]